MLYKYALFHNKSMKAMLKGYGRDPTRQNYNKTSFAILWVSFEEYSDP